MDTATCGFERAIFAAESRTISFFINARAALRDGVAATRIKEFDDGE